MQKIVGKSLCVQGDSSTVFDAAVEKMTTVSARKSIIDHKATILRIFSQAGYDDLRHLYQTLLDVEYFLTEFPIRYLSIDALMKETYELYFIFSLELKKGKIQAVEIRQIAYLAMDRAYLEANEYGQDVMNHPMLRVAEKYSLLYEMSIPPSLWSDLFLKGHMDHKALLRSLRECRYMGDDATPAWKLLRNYKELEEDAFEVTFSQLKQQWEEYAFDAFGEILHVSGIFLFFSSLGLYKYDETEIVKECKAYIDHKKAEGHWRKHEYDTFTFDLELSWEHLDYLERESNGFKQILRYLKREFEVYQTERLAKDTQRLIALINAETAVSHRTSPELQRQKEWLQERAVFASVDFERFFTLYMSLRNKDRQRIARMFADRYGSSHLANVLIRELPFLESFSSSLRLESKKREGKLDGHLLAEIKMLYVDKAIETLNDVRAVIKNNLLIQ